MRLGGGGGTLTLASTNAVGGPVSLDVNVNGTAPGTVVLAAANNFVGTLAVGGGMTLRAEINAALGAGLSAITLDNGVLQTGFSGALSRPISLGAGGGTLDTSGNAVTVGTVISGAGAFTKAGAGTLTLTGANTYTGATTVSAGTVEHPERHRARHDRRGNDGQRGRSAGAFRAASSSSAKPDTERHGVGGNGALRNLAGNNSFNGNITLASASSVVAERAILTIDPATGMPSPVRSH